MIAIPPPSAEHFEFHSKVLTRLMYTAAPSPSSARDKGTLREDTTGGTVLKLSKGMHSRLIESRNVMNYCLPNNAGRCLRSERDELIYRPRRHSQRVGEEPKEAGGERKNKKR